MKYFGTDGIRGIAGEKLDNRLLRKIAKALVIFYSKHRLKKVLLVGNDTRISSDYILMTIGSILLEYGIEIHNIGSVTSPCLAYIARKHHYPLAMMISASHNSYEYNGIKFFNNLGEKLSTSNEQELENYFEKRLNIKKSFAVMKNVTQLKDDYIHFLLRIKKCDLHAIFDCASGATSEIIKRVCTNATTIHSNPNGININLNCGCTHLESLSIKCRKSKTIGFAFDGDGDRMLMVDEGGKVIDGDKLLYVLSKFYQKNGDVLVGTIYSNEGLNVSLKQRNVTLLRSQVGDKKVYEIMLSTGSILGGENSGHIILKHFTNTGDGILNAIIIMNFLSTTHLTINELLKDYTEYSQEHFNLKLAHTLSLDTDEIRTKFKTDNTRIIIRPSGTEPLLRIMVESEDSETAKFTLTKIKNYIEKYFKNQ